MINKKVPIYFTFISFFCGIAIPLAKSHWCESSENSSIQKSNKIVETNSCNNVSYRLKGFLFTKPLLFSEQGCESQNLSGLKNEIAGKIGQLKSAGVIQSASVYIRIFQNGEWTYFNETEKFNPGSLIKVPVMMTYLLAAEKNPSILDHKVKFVPGKEYVPTQTFNSKGIIPGKDYSVRDLMRYMIIYSDNNATMLLNQGLDIPLFKKMFVELGLSEPDVHDKFYQISAKDYSVFFKVLFNGSYLSKVSSDFAINLLSQAEYKDGILKGISDDKITVAHKFGEGGTKELHELHETALVYTSERPYLITVMTKGKNIEALPSVLSQISEIAFNHFK